MCSHPTAGDFPVVVRTPYGTTTTFLPASGVGVGDHLRLAVPPGTTDSVAVVHSIWVFDVPAWVCFPRSAFALDVPLEDVLVAPRQLMRSPTTGTMHPAEHFLRKDDRGHLPQHHSRPSLPSRREHVALLVPGGGPVVGNTGYSFVITSPKVGSLADDARAVLAVPTSGLVCGLPGPRRHWMVRDHHARGAIVASLSITDLHTLVRPPSALGGRPADAPTAA
jgi:hypothetical protein